VQKNELIKAWITIVFFWYMVFYFFHAWGSLGNYFDSIINAVKNEFYRFFNEDKYIEPKPDITDMPFSFSLEFFDWLLKEHWTATVLVMVFLVVVFSFSMGFVIKFAQVRRREKKVKKTSEWRGISVNMGEIMKPIWLMETPEFESTDLDFSALIKDRQEAKRIQALYDNQFPDRMKLLMCQIIWLLNDNPKAFVGSGHTQMDDAPLLDHHPFVCVSQGMAGRG